MAARTFADDVLNVLKRNNNNTVNTVSGTASISAQIATPQVGQKWALKEIRLTLNSAASTGTLTITINSGSGSAYDHLVVSEAMDGVSDLMVEMEPDKIFNSTDVLDVSWPNSSGITYGIESITAPIYEID